MSESTKLLRLADIDYDQLSPMMRQYADLKTKMGETIIFYRLGDFYEMFFDDAIYVSKLLELTLTARDCGSNLRAPMCGVPHHAYQTYINRLITSGHKVAICEQLEDPSVAKGLVKRGIVKVLTPGTVTDTTGLEDKKNNFLMSIYCVGSQFGVSVADITTGTFEATQLTEFDNDEHLINLIGKYLPSEIIYNSDFVDTKVYKAISTGFNTAYTVRNDRYFSASYIKTSGITTDGIDKFKNPELLLCSCSGLLSYAEETQTEKVEYLNRVSCFKINDSMELDLSTRTNLELTQTIRSKSRKGSLLWAIDRTNTAMGGRLLRKWVEEPLISVNPINMRLDAVEESMNKFIPRQEIIEGLTGLYDIERLAAKVSLGSINPREMLSLRNSLGKLPYIVEICDKNFNQGLFKDIKSLLDPMTDIYELLNESISEDAPVTVKEGGIIKEGYSAECDELKAIATNAQQFIMEMESTERERTGIKTLKIGYNRVFGYYIDVPRSFKDELPEEYHRKQTLANNERYVTPALKELEDKLLGADSRRLTLEYELFANIRKTVNEAGDRLFNVAKAVALLDVITSLAELASAEGYVRPVIDDSEILDIKEGRHPVVEKTLKSSARFVPNDTLLNDSDRLMVLTGPNMAGKSTYMRQVALIVLMAQIGSFVPAKSAHIGLVDQIFTRIGSSDDISMGESTFMVEMKEVSSILKNASRKSLLLLDEVGRGTSTYDGLSIAWAVIEYIINPTVLYSRTIFATHYHELNQLSGTDIAKGVFNAHVDVNETNDGVIFLHKIVPGGTSDSYGIEVARLAGVPDEVLLRSRSILKELERVGSFKVHGTEDNSINGTTDSDIFNAERVEYTREDKIREMIKNIDITRCTPLEAMNILYSLIEAVNKENS